MERHQTVGEGIYRVRFGNANGFIAHLGPLSRFLWWRQLDNGEGMAVAPLSGILGRLDFLPASQ
jgi:hypothetical protein